MNQKIKVFGKEITIRKPEPYADIRDGLKFPILLIAIIMLVLSFLFSFGLAMLYLKEKGVDLTPNMKEIDAWFKLPLTFLSLIIIYQAASVMDEGKKKRDRERYNKPLI